MAKIHSGEAFYAFDNPSEAAIFSVLIELMKELEEGQVKSEIFHACASNEESIDPEKA